MNKLILLVPVLILSFATIPTTRSSPLIFVEITVSPENPTIDDYIYVTVTFTITTCPPYVEEFGEVTQSGNVFSTITKVYIPSPDEMVTQIVHEESYTYHLGRLSEGSYRFEVYVYQLNWQEGYIYLANYTTFEVIIPSFEASLDVSPRTLNLYYPPKWAAFYLEISGTLTVDDLNASSLTLNNTLTCRSVIYGDHNNNGIPDLKVKFDGEEFSNYIQDAVGTSSLPANVTLTLSGNFNNGSPFEENVNVQVKRQKAPSYGKAGTFPI